MRKTQVIRSSQRRNGMVGLADGQYIPNGGADDTVV